MKTRQRPGGGRCSIGGGRRTLGRRAIFPESSRLANGTRRRESPVTLRVLLGGRYASSNRFDGNGEPYFEEASATSNDTRTSPRKPRLPRRCFRGDRGGNRRVVPRLLPATATRRAIIQYRVLKRDVARRKRDVRGSERFWWTLHRQRLWDRADRERFLGALGPAGAERLVNPHPDRTEPLSNRMDGHERGLGCRCRGYILRLGRRRPAPRTELLRIRSPMGNGVDRQGYMVNRLRAPCPIRIAICRSE